MTLIVSVKGLIIADSSRQTGEDQSFKTGKIRPYSKPRFIRSRRLNINDTYFGYAGSGDDQVTEFAGEQAGISTFDSWADGYQYVDSLRCLTDQSSFNIMFFGLKGTMTAIVHSGLIRLLYYPHTDYGTVSMGSGADAYHRVMKEHQHMICPVRAAYATFVMEPTCGGAVEVWRAPLSKKEGLVRLDVLTAATIPQCFKTASQPRKLHFPKEHIAWLHQHMPALQKPSPKPSKPKTEQRQLPLPGFRATRWTAPRQESSFHRLKGLPPSPKQSA